MNINTICESDKEYEESNIHHIKNPSSIMKSTNHNDEVEIPTYVLNTKENVIPQQRQNLNFNIIEKEKEKESVNKLKEVESVNEDFACRICLEKGSIISFNENEISSINNYLTSNQNFVRKENTILISPCSCSGSAKYVHLNCINTWIIDSKSFPYICELCNENLIVVEKITKKNNEKKSYKKYLKMLIFFLTFICILNTCLCLIIVKTGDTGISFSNFYFIGVFLLDIALIIWFSIYFIKFYKKQQVFIHNTLTVLDKDDPRYKYINKHNRDFSMSSSYNSSNFKK